MPFIREKCNFCGDCLFKCNYLDLTRDQSIKEMKNLIESRDSFILSECVTCYACNEYCKEDANPFDLIAELQEEHNSLGISQENKNKLEKTFEPYEFTKDVQVKGPLMSQCAFLFSHKQFFRGKLFDDLTLIGGRSVFCNLIYLHSAQYSLIEARASMIVKNIERVLENFEKKELICFHDECYAFYTKYAPELGVEVNFKVIHLFEYLYNYLKEHRAQIKKLNIKIAYQRSCSTRLTPEKDHFLDELLDLIGAKKVDRQYSGENALCCQAPLLDFLNKTDLARKKQKINIQDALNARAEAMVFICPTCYDTLKQMCMKYNLRPIFITDLCRIALGEIE
ncbi:MAG: (Fe-S)-binding protein [Promethearchaeota archaeon]|nr:MAG: (Fe-S)-binding protein [Candidatus Lokiarchaeota archaeon]